MNNTLPQGAQLLINKNLISNKKVTCFTGIPIDIDDLMAVNCDEKEFIARNLKGFILEEVTEESIKIKILSRDSIDICCINFGEVKKITISNIILDIELWATRTDPKNTNCWNISMI